MATLDLTIQDIQAFFIERGATDECPSCKNKAWYFNGHAVEAGYLGIPYTGYPSEDGTANSLAGGFARPVLVITCQNCGFVRIHDRWMVEHWKRTRPQLIQPGGWTPGGTV